MPQTQGFEKTKEVENLHLVTQEKQKEIVYFALKPFSFKKIQDYIDHIIDQNIEIDDWALNLLNNLKPEDFYERNLKLNVSIEKIEDSNEDYLKLKSKFRQNLQEEKAELILLIADFLSKDVKNIPSFFFEKGERKNIFTFHHPIIDSDNEVCIFILVCENNKITLKADYFRHSHIPKKGRMLAYLEKNYLSN